MRDPIAVLKSLTEKSKDRNYTFERLYRNLYNPEFYFLAYKNICSNKGSMTPGIDGSTMDGFSEERVSRIIDALKNQSYQPQPARREYIPKKSNPNKKRPLGIPSGDDKLIQEVVRMLLESIYEPIFLNCSHGFRPKKSCHTALKEIQRTFTGAHWFIEGDIKACFDSFDHQVLIGLLRRRIKDELFISLIWKMLKAGYMEQWVYHTTYCGTPQGSGISPILANVYLHELDCFMMRLKSKFDCGTSRDQKETTEYNIARHKVERYRAKNALVWTEVSEEERKFRAKTLRGYKATMCATHRISNSNKYKVMQYTRYADDFIVGVIGSKQDTEEIKSEVKVFLEQTLHLIMSEEKTKVTHTSELARFLGYDITVSRSQETKVTAKGHRQRVYSYVVQLLVPREKWVNKLLEYGAIKVVITPSGKEHFKAVHRSKLINKTDIEILTAYNSEIRGLYNFYSLANNAFKIGIFANLMKYSMLKTFANKYKTNVNDIKQRYTKAGSFCVKYKTAAGLKEAVFYNQGFKRQKTTMLESVNILPAYRKYDKKNSLKGAIKQGVCELCGTKTDKIELHRIRKLKDLTGTEPWELMMKKRRRKTLAVCPECHKLIHK